MAASLPGWFNAQQFTDAGALASGYRLYTYTYGTTTHKAAYTDAAAAVPHTYVSDGLGGQYIALNARGELPAPLYLTSGSYAIALKTAAGATVWTRRADPIGAALDALADDTSDAAGAGLVAFSYARNYAVGTLGRIVPTFGIDITAEPYLCDPTGAADCGAAMNQIIADFPGVPMHAPAGTFKISTTVNFTLEPTSGAFSAGPRLSGAGMNSTYFDNQVANGYMFNVDSLNHTPGDYQSLQGGELCHFSVIQTGTVAASTAMRVLNCQATQLHHIRIDGMSQDGIEMRNGANIDDGWNMLALDWMWIENCGRWNIKADGDATRNEGSFTHMRHVFLQAGGKQSDFATSRVTITGISKANPAVVSAAGHAFTNGQQVYISGVQGMTEVEGIYTVAGAVAGVSFQLSGVDSTGFTNYSAFVSGTGGQVIAPNACLYSATPTGGNMIWKGQLLCLTQCAMTLGEGVGLFIKGQSGLAIGFETYQTTWENNKGRHILCTGLTFARGTAQFHGNRNYRQHTGVEFDGASFTVRDVDLATVYRASSSTASDGYRTVAYKVSGSNADLDTIRITTTWDSFDNAPAGQTRYSGFRFRAVPNGGELAVLATTSAVFRPRTGGDGEGCKIAARRAGPATTSGTRSGSGEWVEVQIPSGGWPLDNLTAAASTRYYVYLYDNAGSWALEKSTTAPTLDTSYGYQVKTGDSTRHYVGSVITTAVLNANGGYEFATTGTGWLNTTPLAGSQAGVAAYLWADSSSRLRIKNSAPTSDTDGTVVGTQT